MHGCLGCIRWCLRYRGQTRGWRLLWCGGGMQDTRVMRGQCDGTALKGMEGRWQGGVA